MSKYQCVIFDCDGVLVDSEILSNQVMVDMANELGANIDIDYAMTHFKGSYLSACVQRVCELVGVTELPNFETEYRQRSFEAFKEGLQPVAGIKEVLEELSLPFCVASSGPQNKMQLNLEITGLLPFFDGNIFSCYDLGIWKPEPDIFLHAAKTMGFAPSDCVVIEDSPTGVTAAKRAGMTVLGYTARDTKGLLQEQTSATFSSMKELPKLLGL